MVTFLQEVAKAVVSQYKNNLGEITMVFPNRRPIVFFRKYLSDLIDKPVWSPEFFTIQEYMGKLSGIQQEDNLSLIFKLHEIYASKKKNAESLDSFLYWGEMLLADFDDIDKFLIDPKDLFRNLTELKSYEGLFNYLTENQISAIRTFWSAFDPEKYTREQRNFVETWDILYPVYQEFVAKLTQEKLGYEGLIFRNVAEKIEHDTGETGLSGNKVIMVGFNALNQCEHRLFNWLKQTNQADFFWDVNVQYLQQSNHQAGRFLRENIRRYPHPLYAESIITTEHCLPKKMHSYSVDFVTAQPAISNHILKTLAKDKTPGPETAIILADEGLMFPLLHALPEEAGGKNVTMGFPLKNSNTFGYIQELLNLVKSVKHAKDGSRYYYKPVLNLLRHPFSLQLEPDLTKSIQENIFSQNKFMIENRDIEGFKSFRSWFTPVNNGRELFELILYHLEKVARFIIDQESHALVLELEFVHAAIKTLNRLSDVIDARHEELTLSSLIRLISKVLQGISVPFSGEPVSGLQIMGVLESRTLDFKNLIILSLNEGHLPKRTGAPSYIPDNLRYAFNIPTYDHQDSIYTYYFYRLLHRAESVHFVYSTRAVGLETGEKSRFLYQLEMLEGCTIPHQHLNFPIRLTPAPGITIEKDQDVLGKILEYSEKGNRALSPSAINTYIDCSLRFYFRYVAGLKEVDELKETIDPPSFGNILHGAIEEIYASRINKELAPNDIGQILEDELFIDAVINKAYALEYLKLKEVREPQGADVLVLNVLKKYLKQILLLDKRTAPLTFRGLENEYTVELNLPGNKVMEKVRIGGKIDRIDQVREGIRIIDYKTGAAENRITTMEDMFDGSLNKRNKPALQTFLYAYLYFKNNSHERFITPGLYPIRELMQEAFDYRLYFTPAPRQKQYIDDFAAFSDDFESLLQSCLGGLFSSEIPFTQTANTDHCRHCPYASICRR